jgi:hypothetical protein
MRSDRVLESTFFLFRSSTFGKWIHVFPRERGSSGLPSRCLSSWTRLRGPLLQPVRITIWFDNARHRWGGEVSALHVATEYSWYDAVTVTRHCFHLNNVLLSWFYIVSCPWNCLLPDVSVFQGWHQTTWHTEIRIRRHCKDYLDLHVWVLGCEFITYFCLFWCERSVSLCWQYLDVPYGAAVSNVASICLCMWVCVCLYTLVMYLRVCELNGFVIQV